jgi:hypothetical protein
LNFANTLAYRVSASATSKKSFERFVPSFLDEMVLVHPPEIESFHTCADILKKRNGNNNETSLTTITAAAAAITTITTIACSICINIIA